MSILADPALVKRAFEDFQDYKTFLPAHHRLHTKSGVEIPATLSPAGLRLFEAAEAQRARRVPVRVLALKARQVYMSYATALYISRMAMFAEQQNALVYTHEHASTQKIFKYYDEIYKSYTPPVPNGPAILPRIRRIQDRLMGFDGGGEIAFRSADNTKGGRSSANRHVHLSEYAFWRDAATLMTGVMASVPKDSGTTIIVESTANGMAGDFFEFWEGQKQKGTGWAPIFFAWWEHPEYTLPLTMPRIQFQESMSKEEHALMATYRLTLEQVNWRRYVVDTEYKGNADSFRQEYPANAEEAFLMSGRPRFNRADIVRQPIIKDAPDGELQEVRIGSRLMIQFMPTEGGSLRMFRRPEKGHTYVIGADTSEGIDAANGAVGASDPDYSVAQVLDRHSGEQVARYRARVHPAEFGRVLADLGHCYNDAYLIPEANNTGIATIEELERQDYPQELIYHRERDPDDKSPHPIRRIGWKTTVVTRPQLVSALDGALRESAIYVRDDITRAELYRFVINPKGKPEAAAGAHDDCVIALALAVVGLGQAPMDRPKKAEKARPNYETRLSRYAVVEEDEDE